MTPLPLAPTVATKARRQFDSSRTRVGPIIGALSEESTGDPHWLRRVLDLAAGPGPRPWNAQDLEVRERYHHPAPGATKSKERGLQPPVALLSWLIRIFPVAEADVLGDDTVAKKRQALARRDPAVIAIGGRAGVAWCFREHDLLLGVAPASAAWYSQRLAPLAAAWLAEQARERAGGVPGGGVVR